jgi:hypothetical protein
MNEKEGFYKIFYITDGKSDFNIKKYDEWTIIVKATGSDDAKKQFKHWADKNLSYPQYGYTIFQIVKIEHIITPDHE